MHLFLISLFVLRIFSIHVDKNYISNRNYPKITDYPFMVKITIIRRKGQVSLCCGSYVHSYWVLSAAHCVDKINRNSTVTCCMGGVYADLKHCEQSRNVARVYSLPSRDISLLRLAEPFPPEPEIGSMALVSLYEAHPKHCYVAGWGKTKDKKFSDRLLAMEVNYYDSCIYPDKYCVFGKHGGPCEGDSGSPLVCDGLLFGVLNGGYSNHCGDVNVVYIYTRIDKELNFIGQVIGENYNSRSQNRQCSGVLLLVCWVLHCK